MSKQKNNPVLYIDEPYFNFVDDLMSKSKKPKKIRMNGISLDDVVETIRGNDIVIIYRENCGYSKRARKLLRDSGLDFVEIDIDQIDATPMELREHLSSEFSDFGMYRTLPMIFMRGQFRRGADELEGILRR